MKISSTKQQLISDLEKYDASDMIEQKYKSSMLDFLTISDNPFFVTTNSDHITVSAILLNRRGSSILLLWHQKLGRWLQPGGHCEENDLSLTAAAFRELLEETEIDKEKIYLVKNAFFDIDIHQIPEQSERGYHLHYDLRYLFALNIDVQLNLSFSWMTLENLLLQDASLSRVARKLLLM